MQAMVSDTNTMFIENVIFIMKNILENKADQPSDHLGITSIETLMLAIVRLVHPQLFIIISDIKKWALFPYWTSIIILCSWRL